MIDPLLSQIAAFQAEGIEDEELIDVLEDMAERIVDLERKVRNQAATINKLVGRANE